MYHMLGSWADGVYIWSWPLLMPEVVHVRVRVCMFVFALVIILMADAD